MKAIRAAEPEGVGEPISEAIALPAGLLVARERGVHLLTPDGRARARWDVRATGFTIADDGATALIASRGGNAFELHRLDLVTYGLTRLATLAGYGIATTFDGSIVTVETHDGLKAIDLTTDPPRTVWSAFRSSNATVEEHQRTSTRLSAIVCFRRHGTWEIGGVERWTWELPSRRLIDRQADTGGWGHAFTVAAPLRVSATTADGTLLYIDRAPEGLVEHVKPIDGPESVRPLDNYAEFAVDGDHSALLQETATDARVTLRGRKRHAPVAVVTFPGTRFANFRAHGDTATTYTDDGRIVAIDLQTREVLVNLPSRA